MTTKKRNRSLNMGATPGKGARTGLEVQARSKLEGRLRTRKGRIEFKCVYDDKWYSITLADMCHKEDAVLWWNRLGRKYGPKAPEVRAWMLDSDNYYLGHRSHNRSAGAKLGVKYLKSSRKTVLTKVA
jgi:hypothetical protein